MEDEEFEVIGFGDVPEDGVIGALLAGFDLAEPHAGISGGVVEHLLEIGFGHEVRAGAGGEIAAARQELHGFEVDLFVALDRVFERVASLGKGGGIEDDKIVVAFARLRHVGEQIKHVGADEIHASVKPVADGVLARHGDRVGGDVHRGHVRGTPCGGVETKGARVGKAIEHAAAVGDLANRRAVVLLVKEKAVFLPVYIVHLVADPVFHDLGLARNVGRKPLARPKGGVLLHALQRADGNVVPLVERIDLLAEFVAQQTHQKGIELALDALDAK